MNAFIISVMKRHYNVELDYDDQNMKVLQRWREAFGNAALIDEPVEEVIIDVEKAGI